MTATLRPRRTIAPSANRILAAIIDLGIVALAPLAAGLAMAERFRVLDPGDGPDRFAAADQGRIDQLGRGFSRAIEWEGWLYVLDTMAWSVTVAAAAAAALFISVAFPLAAGGRSPGKGLTGLRVVSVDGRPASASQLAVRTVAGPIDLLPLVVPGLVAAVSASTDPARRRLGDRLADTRVTIMPSQWVAGPASSGPGLPDGRPGRFEPFSSGSDAAIAVADVADPPTIVLADPRPTIVTRHDPDRHLARQLLATTDAEPSDVATPAPPLRPVHRIDGSPTRSPRSRRGGTRADIDLVGHRPPSAEATSLGDATDYALWSPDPDPVPDRPTIRPPEAESFEALLLAESSLAEAPGLASVRPVTESRPRPLPRRITNRDQRDQGQRRGGGPARPIWDQTLGAWVYQDASTGRWYRHDAEIIRWRPIVDR